VLALILATGVAVAEEVTPAGGAAAGADTSGGSAPRRSLRSQGEQPILFSADEVQTDEQLGLILAKGHVEITQGERTLLADTVTYNRNTDTITASGNVSLNEPTGEVLFADFLELENRFENGFIKDIRILLSDRSRLAANTGRRTNGVRTEMRRGVYSPCDLCKEDPTRPPLWQIRAAEITHDKEAQTIEYRDATIEFGGIPLLYTPYLAHADPSVKRRSGLLPPTVGLGGNLGAHIALPYYWAIGPDRDATFTPLFTTDAGQVAAGEYRQRFSNGEMRLSGSINNGERPEDTSQYMTRGNIAAYGRFDLDPTWRTGFDVARSTDQTYLQRFHFNSESSFLTSRLFAEQFQRRSFLGIDAYSFQPLRQGVSDSGQPIVTPVVNYNWLSEPDRYGGQLSLDANFLNLNRSRGTGNHRMSIGTAWNRPFLDAIGGVYNLTLSTRGDGYYSTDLQLSPGEQAQDPTAGRVFPQAGLEWRYPLVRRGSSFSQLIEPIVAVYAAPRGGNPARIPNDDSTAFDYDETDLFIGNREPGLDRVDGGQRVDYGMHAAIYGDTGGSTSVLVGQSRRATKENGFPQNSGVEDRSSDIVGHLLVAPSGYFDAGYRYRLDKNNLRPRRQEVSFGGGPESLRLSISYMRLPPDFLSTETNNRQQLVVGGTAQISRYWSLAVATTRNLVADPGTVSSSAVATYQDECLAFIMSLSQSGTRNRDVKPGASLVFTLVLKNLGQITAPAFSTTGIE